jgi:hypothetical protein
MLVIVSQSHFRDYVIVFSYMLKGIILDRVGSITDLGVLMDSRMSFSRHIDVTNGKAVAMLGFVKRLSGEFSILLGPFMCRLCTRSLSTQVVCGGLFMTITSIGLSVYRENSLARVARAEMDRYV